MDYRLRHFFFRQYEDGEEIIDAKNISVPQLRDGYAMPTFSDLAV